jgi:hypothetical protein
MGRAAISKQKKTGERAPEKIPNTNKKNPKLWQKNSFAVFSRSTNYTMFARMTYCAP